MIHLRLAVQRVAAGAAELADVPALELRARGQDHVGKLRLALEPDRLAHHEIQVLVAVGLHAAVFLWHRAQRTPPLPVQQPATTRSKAGTADLFSIDTHPHLLTTKLS